MPPAVFVADVPGEVPLVAPARPPSVRVGRTVSDHPVLWRELRRPLLGTRRSRVALVIICLMLIAVSYIAIGRDNGLRDSDTQIGYGVIFQTLTMLITAVIAATAIAQEKEGDTWTVLLASPLSGRAIVWSKALGAARRLLWPVIGMTLHFSLFVIAGVITPTTLLTLMTVIVAFNTIWVATGIALSLRCRKVTIAVILNLALPVLLYGALSLVLVVIDTFLHLNGDLMSQMAWWQPYYWIASAGDMGGFGSNQTPRMPGQTAVHVSQETFFAWALAVSVLHVGAAVAILSATAAQFNLIVGRAPQRDRLGPPPAAFPAIRVLSNR
jgi:ABC-type transport system involved in multi-copper enzyme maturation permease subunit